MSLIYILTIDPMFATRMSMTACLS
jgi:hypothetical protein